MVAEARIHKMFRMVSLVPTLIEPPSRDERWRQAPKERRDSSCPGWVSDYALAAQTSEVFVDVVAQGFRSGGVVLAAHRHTVQPHNDGWYHR